MSRFFFFFNEIFFFFFNETFFYLFPRSITDREERGFDGESACDGRDDAVGVERRED